MFNAFKRHYRIPGAFLCILATLSTLKAENPPPFQLNLANPIETQDYDSFDCGLVTRYSANRLPKNCLQEALNVLVDEDFAVTRRNGQSPYTASPCQDAQSIRGLWPFRATDGNNYLVILSSQTLFYTSDGICNPIGGLTGTLSATAEMDCVQTLGRLWCTNGSDEVFSWDGSTMTWIPTAPKGNVIGAFRNRLWLGDISGSLSRVRGSGELDGTNWAVQIPGKSTTPANVDLGGINDGNNVTALMGQYQDVFLIGKEDSLWGLYGNDRRNFTLKNFSWEVGVLDYKSIKEKNNALYWLSKRGIEKFSGTTLNRVSDPIRPNVDEIIKSAGNSRSLSQTTQAHWDDGQLAVDPLSPMSANISPGNVTTSTVNARDLEGSTWANGTMVNVTTVVASGNLYYYQGAGHHAFINAGAESNNDTNWDVRGWGSHVDKGCFGSNRGWARNIAADCPATLKMEILNKFGTLLHERTDSISNGENCEDVSIDISTYTAQQIVIRFTNTSGGGGTTINTSKPFVRGNNFDYATSDDPNVGVNYCSQVFDINESNIITSGTIVSRTFDTFFSTPVAGPFTVSMTSDSLHPITFETRSATSSAGAFNAWTTQNNNADFAGGNREYWQYRATFGDIGSSTGTSGSLEANIDSVNMAGTTTGYYIPNCFNTTPIASWKNIDVNFEIVNRSTATIYVSSGPTCNGATRSTNTWTTQTNNSIVTIATSSFLGVRIRFDPVSSTDVVKLQDITVRWNDVGNRPRVASAIYRNRYNLFYTTSTLAAAANDHVLVLNENDKWTIYEGISARSATIFQRELYTGDSANTGIIRKQDTGYDDNGNAFNMAIKTIDDDFGDSTKRKLYHAMYVEFKSETDPSDEISINAEYFIDGSTTPYSLGTIDLGEADEPGIFSAKVPFPATQRRDGKWLALRLRYNGTDGPVTIYKIKVYYEPLEKD